MDENKNKTTENIFLSRGMIDEPHTNDRDNQHFKHGCCKLDSSEWFNHISCPATSQKFDYAEVRFKNSHKEFFKIQNGYELKIGDIIAVEASPGHDLGIVSLTGESARLQMRKRGLDSGNTEFKQIYRRARISDIEKWVEAIGRERPTLTKTKNIVDDLKLEMKMNDVEYQGDNTKAVFYYTAEDRVDFRELIKLLADEFKIRIEMRQIGVRQEAARLGGIGSCGRELCCSTWVSKFKSVTTNTARIQQLSLNPQKLAGQCSKLKCCLNFENDTYLDALKDFPDMRISIKTKKGEANHQKTDVLKKIMWYSYDNDRSNIMAIDIENINKILEMNKRGNLPEKLEDFAVEVEKKVDFDNGGADADDFYKFE
ncbi:stage 0 sporulation family protein [Bacteroidota bacterium]